eukprot:Gb_27210 [translate_table: standard]
MPAALVWHLYVSSTRDLDCKENGKYPYECTRFRRPFGVCLVTRRCLQDKKTKQKGRYHGRAALGASDTNSVPGIMTSLVLDPSGKPMLSSEQRVYDVVLKQAAMVGKPKSKNQLDVKPEIVSPITIELLNQAYERCGEICAEYAKTFYLGTLLMTQERRKAIWAIYVYLTMVPFFLNISARVTLVGEARVSLLYIFALASGINRRSYMNKRTDELVDGPNASHITPVALDRWEQRLEDLFDGHPYDMLDAALSDTVSKFPVDIQPFRDMIEGMRMDLRKSRYKKFDELYLYCYYVAGTVGLMSVPVMGIAAESKATIQSVYSAALALGIANQLTNILRDVGEDARRGRIYLPQDELAQFGLSDEDIFAGKVNDRWRAFMKDQIARARMFFNAAEEGVTELDKASRWPVWASLILYRQILDAIEANDYNNFSKRAYVSKMKKILALPVAYTQAFIHPLAIPKLAGARY